MQLILPNISWHYRVIATMLALTFLSSCTKVDNHMRVVGGEYSVNSYIELPDKSLVVASQATAKDTSLGISIKLDVQSYADENARTRYFWQSENVGIDGVEDKIEAVLIANKVDRLDTLLEGRFNNQTPVIWENEVHYMDTYSPYYSRITPQTPEFASVKDFVRQYNDFYIGYHTLDNDIFFWFKNINQKIKYAELKHLYIGIQFSGGRRIWLNRAEPRTKTTEQQISSAVHERGSSVKDPSIPICKTPAKDSSGCIIPISQFNSFIKTISCVPNTEKVYNNYATPKHGTLYTYSSTHEYERGTPRLVTVEVRIWEFATRTEAYSVLPISSSYVTDCKEEAFHYWFPYDKYLFVFYVDKLYELEEASQIRTSFRERLW